MKLTPIYFLLILLIVQFACSGTRRIENHDLTTEGFITDSCFQVIINAKPDIKKDGLVDSRESSLKNAHSLLPGEVQVRLINYYLDFYKQNKNIKDNSDPKIIEIKPIVAEAVKKYLPNGYRAYSYYNEDKSIVIIYRICSNNFKNEFISMNIVEKLKEKKESKK